MQVHNNYDDIEDVLYIRFTNMPVYYCTYSNGISWLYGKNHNFIGMNIYGIKERSCKHAEQSRR